MDRLDFYFRQLVLESDLDLAFDQTQERIEQVTSEHETSMHGMCQNGLVLENTVPDLYTIITGDAYGYTPEGKRLSWVDQVILDCSEDELALSTAVSGPGNSRWLSICGSLLFKVLKR